MRFVSYVLISAVAALGCEQRGSQPNAAPSPVTTNAALAPNQAAARPSSPPDMVEIDLDGDDDGVAPERAGRHGEANGEPMDEVDDGSDISGAPEKTGAFDDPAASDSEATER